MELEHTFTEPLNVEPTPRPVPSDAALLDTYIQDALALLAAGDRQAGIRDPGDRFDPVLDLALVSGELVSDPETERFQYLGFRNLAQAVDIDDADTGDDLGRDEPSREQEQEWQPQNHETSAEGRPATPVLPPSDL